MIRKSVIEPVTLAALLASLGIAVVGAVSAGGDAQLQNVVTSLALVAAITGIYANRRALGLERRSLALGALSEEIEHNLGVLDDAAFQPMTPSEPARVYPRLQLSAVDATLASRALDAGRDSDLVRDLHRWRNAANELNRRLDLAETIAFLSGSEAVTAQQLDAGLHQPDGHFERARDRLRRMDHLVAAFAGERRRPGTGV